MDNPPNGNADTYAAKQVNGNAKKNNRNGEFNFKNARGLGLYIFHNGIITRFSKKSKFFFATTLRVGCQKRKIVV
jgi:hypothetical protein